MDAEEVKYEVLHPGFVRPTASPLVRRAWGIWKVVYWQLLFPPLIIPDLIKIVRKMMG